MRSLTWEFVVLLSFPILQIPYTERYLHTKEDLLSCTVTEIYSLTNLLSLSKCRKHFKTRLFLLHFTFVFSNGIVILPLSSNLFLIQGDYCFPSQRILSVPFDHKMCLHDLIETNALSIKL